MSARTYPITEGLHLAAIRTAARVSREGRNRLILEATQAGIDPAEIARTARIAPKTVRDIIRKEKSNA